MVTCDDVHTLLGGGLAAGGLLETGAGLSLLSVSELGGFAPAAVVCVCVCVYVCACVCVCVWKVEDISYQPFNPMETNYLSGTFQITSKTVPLVGDGVAVVTAGNGGGTRRRFPSPTPYMAGIV